MSATTAAAGPVSAVCGAVPNLPTVVGGVRLGTTQYNYRDIPRLVDNLEYMDIIALAAAQAGGGLLEYHGSMMIEPRHSLPESGIPRPGDVRPGGPWQQLPPDDLQRQRETLRQWRLSTPMSYFEAIRRKVEARGVVPFAVAFVFTPDMTDAEVDYGFRMARALGVRVFNTSSKVEMGPRLLPYAERYDMILGWHNHANWENPNEIASWESIDKVLAMSPRYYSNLDVGWMAGSNLDAVEFLKRRHDRISHIHMKDRKRDKGPGTPWGEGDAPLKEVIQLIKQNQWPISCLVEYEYPGKLASIDETKKCFQMMREWLA